MKTTKADFEEFKAAFLKYADLFGLKDYQFAFRHEKLHENYAEIRQSEPSKWMVVCLSTEWKDDESDLWVSPEHSAKHEAIHALLCRFSYLAKSRTVIPADINDEEEGIVRVLEKVITLKT